MPVSERKWWIYKHNSDVEEEEDRLKNANRKNKVSFTGEVLNDYAKTEQNMLNNAGL